MRTSRTFTIELELAKKLMKETNQSHLINTLLTDYFKKKEFDGLNKKELNKELLILKLKEETKLKIEEIRNGK